MYVLNSTSLYESVWMGHSKPNSVWSSPDLCHKLLFLAMPFDLTFPYIFTIRNWRNSSFSPVSQLKPSCCHAADMPAKPSIYGRAWTSAACSTEWALVTTSNASETNQYKKSRQSKCKFENANQIVKIIQNGSNVLKEMSEMRNSAEFWGHSSQDTVDADGPGWRSGTGTFRTSPWTQNTGHVQRTSNAIKIYFHKCIYIEKN